MRADSDTRDASIRALWMPEIDIGTDDLSVIRILCNICLAIAL